jgi:hypothetical protein
MPSSGANRGYAGYAVQDAGCGLRRIGASLTGRNSIYICVYALGVKQGLRSLSGRNSGPLDYRASGNGLTG